MEVVDIFMAAYTFVFLVVLIVLLIWLGKELSVESKERIKKEKLIQRFFEVDMDFYYHELKEINESLRIIADKKEKPE